MRFALDPAARSPIFRQLEDQVRYAISVGELAPGDSLPSIRELETRLQINRNTVRRAYLNLEAEGLLVLRQGREARVAERSPLPALGDADLQAAAEGLVSPLLQRAESQRLDALQLAEYFSQVARVHDAARPKCAFLECCDRQAQHGAQSAARHLGRHVVGMDLHALRDGTAKLPASVRFVFTPHWHAAQARDLFGENDPAVFGIGVQLSAASTAALRDLQGGALGLVVRDAESAPGYADLVRQHTGTAAARVFVAHELRAQESALQELDSLVYTPPCEEAVRAAAGPRVRLQELVFEPIPDDLYAAREGIFRSLTRQAYTA